MMSLANLTDTLVLVRLKYLGLILVKKNLVRFMGEISKKDPQYNTVSEKRW